MLSSTNWGWPSCFYVWGIATLIWAALYLKFGKESPAEHPNIPKDEREFIECSLGVIETTVVSV